MKHLKDRANAMPLWPVIVPAHTNPNEIESKIMQISSFKCQYPSLARTQRNDREWISISCRNIELRNRWFFTFEMVCECVWSSGIGFNKSSIHCTQNARLGRRAVNNILEEFTQAQRAEKCRTKDGFGVRFGKDAHSLTSQHRGELIAFLLLFAFNETDEAEPRWLLLNARMWCVGTRLWKMDANGINRIRFGNINFID